MWTKKAFPCSAALLLTAGMAVISTAQNQPPPPEPTAKKLTAGEVEARKLLLLMDADKNGKVSKEEFMRFMEAEFDRLDTDKSGYLDVKELTQLSVRPHTGPHR